MVNPKVACHPTICYRPIRPSDLLILEQLHADAFPIRYESEFFQNVVNARDIVSWGAVDRSRPGGHSDELIGFVTARIVMAKESEIADLLSYDSSKSDQTLVYILTLGVVDNYRNRGIASSLIREVLKYSSSISTCRAVYLHVISYNNPAIHLYKKMSFKCVRRLHGFYLINGQHYDSFLFVYYVNGGRSPCSPLFDNLSFGKKKGVSRRILGVADMLFSLRMRELLTVVVSYLRRGVTSVASRLRKNEEKMPRWLKCKETRCLLTTKSRRNHTTECTGFECV